MEHNGHRKRLRARFQVNELDGFAPHEALEMLLTYAIPRMDTNALAHRLIDHFGSLRGVLEATWLELVQVDGIGENAATLIAMQLPLYRMYRLEMLDEKCSIMNGAAAARRCQALLLGKQMEVFYLICMNASMRVICTVKIAEGSVNEVPVYPRNLLAAAINHKAKGVLLTHNHPGGNPEPSQEDVDMTMELYRMLSTVQITLYDHIIIAGNDTFSFRTRGYFAAGGAPELQLAAERPSRVISPSPKKNEPINIKRKRT